MNMSFYMKIVIHCDKIENKNFIQLLFTYINYSVYLNLKIKYEEK